MDVVIDPIQPSDEPALRAWFESVSPDSRYQRFHSHVSKLTDAQWRYLTHVDGITHVALVARVGGKPAGVGRLILRAGAAEIAFLVDDDHQRCGIGSILRDRLLDIARERGIYRLQAHVLPSNIAMRRLFDLPEVAVSDRGDVIEVVLPHAA
jgi:GNAT superfamily N-acetyltransferase